MVALIAAGCATSSSSQGTTASGSVPFGDRISALFGGGSPPPASATPATPTSEEFDCPRIDIRPGASTLLVNSRPDDNSALALRYQGSFVRAARECRVQGSNVSIKVGVQGRVILGPAGVPGELKVPLRYALVYETLGESKSIWSKLYLVQVTIPPQTSTVSFTHIEESLNVPIPNAGDLDSWVIYIGFDPVGAEQELKKKPPRKAAQPRPPRR